MKRTVMVTALVLVILAIDQSLKFWIKTHFYYNEELNLIGEWARLHFLENEGMAFGARFHDLPVVGKYLQPQTAKFLLTSFRIVAVGFIIYFLGQFIKKKYTPGFIYSMGLILAGAIGNIIDSVFYGRIFSASDPFTRNVAEFMPPGGGYAPWFQGKVVDMFYFPLVNTYLPGWIPIFGGQHIEFFRPVFNVADASICVGITIVLLFYREYFISDKNEKKKPLDVDAL